METSRKRALRSWLFLGALAALSLSLGILQYRWVGEVSRAEHERLRSGLQGSLNRLAQDFNTEVTAVCLPVLSVSPEPDQTLRLKRYASSFLQWKESAHHPGLIRGVWVAAQSDGSAMLRVLRPDSEGFAPAEWPDAWSAIRERLEARPFDSQPRGGFEPGRRGFFALSENLPDVFELPRFDRMEPGGFPGRRPEPGPPGPFPSRRLDLLLFALDLDYVRTVVVPELLQRHFGSAGSGQYQAAIVLRENPAEVIYESDAGTASGVAASADASVRLFELRMDLMRRTAIRRVGGPFGPAGRRNGEGRAGPPEPMPDRGRWVLSVRHRAGSLEAVVASARRRNLAVAGGILLLIVGAAITLVRFTRRAQTLADLQMEFVAGVSHELRTPLSVMRTAGHNLRGRMAEDPARVQRYGALIEEESEKLGAIVDQVLRFASAEAGRGMMARERIPAGAMLEDALSAERRRTEESGCTLEKRIAPDLPDLLGDRTALGHALCNLVANAVKYGGKGGWLGASVECVSLHGVPWVSFRIADRGPGIPRNELARVFDPFYRGKQAVEEQIHGTGLGLSLAKRVVEAHGGVITVRSEPGKGTEFAVRIPAAPPEEHASQDSASRG